MKKLAYILPSLLLFLMPLFAQAALVATYKGVQSETWGTRGTPMFPSVPVGSAYANRRVLVSVDFTYSLAANLTDVQINGTSVGSNYILDDGGSSWLGAIVWAWADVPKGTTVSVDLVTGSQTYSGYGKQNCYAYTFDNTLAASAPTHHKAIGSSGTSAANTIATGAGGFLISSMHLYALTSQTSITLSASDEGMTTDYTYAASQTTQGIASKVSGTSSSGANSSTWSWASAATSLNSMLYWGPADATPAPARKMRLFEGFKIKLISGKMILYQQ
jgi:hypothetical protein